LRKNPQRHPFPPNGIVPAEPDRAKIDRSAGLQSGRSFPSSVHGMSFYDRLKWTADGLIPAIIQEQSTGRVLMMAWMNRASLEKTIETGRTFFWSRSRQKFWMKGESSGHVQVVKDIAFDCDGDTLLIQVEQTGAACHEGYQSCFFRSIEGGATTWTVTEAQLQTPDAIYGKQ
jgi:phosphoribosyl-AMP cyclohydrolase